MRLNVERAVDKNAGGLSPAGGNVTDKVVVNAPITDPNHAVVKAYVEAKRASMDLSKFTGTLAVERLPAMTGDASSTSGTSVAMLNNTVVGGTGGIWKKVNVSVKGFVVSGDESLSGSDIPLIPFSKLSNKPTTLAGWGITNAIGKDQTGQVMTGRLFVLGQATIPNHIVNKDYIDYGFSDIKKNSVGTYIVSSSPTVYPAPSAKHLRCNGSIISRTSYPELSTSTGDKLVGPNVGMDGGSGWVNISRETSGPTNYFSLGSANKINIPDFPITISGAAVAVTKNRVYVIGGTTSDVPGDYKGVYTATITAGIVGSFSPVGNLPVTALVGTAITAGNHIYMSRSSMGPNDPVNTIGNIYRTPIAPDGTIGAWSVAGNFPHGKITSMIARGDYLYIGAHVGYEKALYRARINQETGVSGWERLAGFPNRVDYNDGEEIKLAMVREWLIVLVTSRIASTGKDIYIAKFDENNALNALTKHNSNSNATYRRVGEAYICSNYALAMMFGLDYVGNVYTSSSGQKPMGVTYFPGQAWQIGTVYNSDSGLTPRGWPIVFITENSVYVIGGYDGTSWLKDGARYPLSTGANRSDFSSYYNELNVTPGNMKLPDESYKERYGIYTYIRALP